MSSEQDATNDRASAGAPQPQEVAPPAPFEKYEYTPLAADNSNLRLVILRPGDFNNDRAISIRLVTVPFYEQAEKYIYEALSYRWGSMEGPKNIFIMGEHDLFTLSVSQNCYQALRHLRYPDKFRVLWIDAICINQGDLDERARQVSIMRSIYAKAHQVVVWLGPAEDNSDLAIEWIDSVCKEVEYSDITKELRSLTEERTRLESKEVIASTAELEAFVKLIEREYFDRLWVWQEVRMGGENVVLKCGGVQTAFKSLMTAVSYANRKPTRGDIGVQRLAPRTHFIRNLPLIGEYIALDALDSIRACRCFDQKDRIYTIQAFAKGFQSLQIPVDYRRDAKDVYCDLVLKYLAENNNLEFLTYVGDHVQSENEEGRVAGLPSSVPDWSSANKAPRLTLGFASGGSAASAVSIDNECLKVLGITIGTVDKMRHFGFNLQTHRNTNAWSKAIHQTLQAIVPRGIMLETAQRNPEDRKRFRQLIRVLSNDSYREKYVPSSSRPTFGEAERHITAALWGLLPQILTQEQAYVQQSFFTCRGRSLFVTPDGKVGVGPHDMQEGDALVVLLGCPNVMVIRPASNGCNRIIGNALLSGTMDGEAILGSLPEGYDTLSILNEASGAHNPAFHHKETGDIVYNDPRLPPMGSEWKVGTDPAGSNAPLYWRHETTKEWRPYTRDPRLDADTLRERGVELEEFVFV